MKQYYAVCDKCKQKEEMDWEDIRETEFESEISLPSGWHTLEGGEEMDLCPDCDKRYQEMIKRFKNTE